MALLVFMLCLSVSKLYSNLLFSSAKSIVLIYIERVNHMLNHMII